MSVTDAPEPPRPHRRGGLGQRRPRRRDRRRPTASSRTGSRSPMTRPGCAPWSAGCCAAGVAEVGIERPDGPVVDALLRGRADRARHPARPAQEPAQPLRLGREQGRPVRRLRAGRCGAHRPAPAAPAAGRHPGHHRAAPDRAGPPGPGRPPGRGGQPAARPPADRVPRRGRAVRRHRLRRSACASWSASPPRTAPTGSRPKRLAAWLASVGYSGRTLTRDPARPAARRPHAAPPARPRTPPPPSPPRSSPCCAPSPPRSRPSPPASPNSSTCTPTPRSSPACPAPAASAPPGCSPRSATPAAGSPPPTRWPAWPGSHPPPASPARSEIVTFRWGADKQLRDALCDFAGDSRHANPWAADLYAKARARGHDHPHAVRILARAWVDIIWRCWTTNTPYDPAKHGALQRILNQDQPTAA